MSTDNEQAAKPDARRSTAELRQQLEAAIATTNTSMKMVADGELPLWHGVVRVQYMMSFIRRLIEECSVEETDAIKLVDWRSIARFAELMGKGAKASK